MKKMGDKMKVAIPTQRDKGLDDTVSDVFGKAETFTIIEISNNNITRVDILKNPAAFYKHGAGPIAIKTLIDKGITTVAAYEFGIGVSTLLDQQNIEKITIKAGIPVKTALKIIRPSLSFNKNEA
jgi:predicted Fe-Mo cluster-binding NifX family protein